MPPITVRRAILIGDNDQEILVFQLRAPIAMRPGDTLHLHVTIPDEAGRAQQMRTTDAIPIIHPDHAGMLREQEIGNARTVTSTDTLRPMRPPNRDRENFGESVVQPILREAHRRSMLLFRHTPEPSGPWTASVPHTDDQANNAGPPDAFADRQEPIAPGTEVHHEQAVQPGAEFRRGIAASVIRPNDVSVPRTIMADAEFLEQPLDESSKEGEE